ncbi:hypothetical protein BKA82DRAFT_32576 [Pisolithus tinctorius]|nr:hypothetical protein BKA82DRAFT_32576 [Pisolithus tinctorius]
MNINLVPTPSDSVFCLSELSPTLRLYSPSEIRGLRSCKGVAHELNQTPSLRSASVSADFVPANTPPVGVSFSPVGLASEPLSRPYIALELVGVGPDLTEPVSKHQCWLDKAKGKRPWTEVNSVDGSDYGHYSEEELAPPTKPSTKWKWIDDHPAGTSNAQEDNRWQNQSTSDQHNTATAYPNPADNHANDGVNSTARKPKPKPRIRSNGRFPCTLG